MSNTLLQNAGFETFFNIEDLESPGFEGDLYGEISSFTKDIWTNTRCSEMEEDDLPLTKYLLQFNTEEQWDSEEEISVEGESFENSTCADQLGWDMDPVDLDTEIFDTVEATPDKTDTPSKEEQVKELKEKVEKSGPVKETSNVGNLQGDINLSSCHDKSDSGKKHEIKKKNSAPKSFSKVDSAPNGRKSAKSQTQFKVAIRNVSNSTVEPHKSLSTAKSQAEKAKEQRERKKKYVQELQDNIEELKRDKAGLQQVTAQLNDKLEAFREEIRYLKGVIANQSELARILRSVTNTPGISLSCGILQDREEGNDGKTNKRKCDAPNDSGKKGVNLRQENSKRRKLDKTASGEMSPVDAGVCVHVQSGKVSLEFCAECSIKASSIIN